jgi:Protein of unknown function (DUF2934)
MAEAKAAVKKPAAKSAAKPVVKAATPKKPAAKPVKKTIAKKPVVKKPVVKKPAAPLSRKVVAAPGAEERYKMVEVAAYYIAERNGFVGDPSAFWAEAEMQISKLLKF